MAIISPSTVFVILCFSYRGLAMASLPMSVALSCLPRKILPSSRQSLDGSSQAFHTNQCSRLEISGVRVGAQRDLVRARRGGGGGTGDEEDARSDGRKWFVSPNLEVNSEGESRVDEPRRSVWERGLGFVGRKLGFGEPWEEDPRGRRELEELDLFLEGRGAEFRWKDVLEPSVENILALVLTGLFLYAAVLIGWQLLLVAAAITLSALKYTVIAAILLGVLIFFI